MCYNSELSLTGAGSVSKVVRTLCRKYTSTMLPYGWPEERGVWTASRGQRLCRRDGGRMLQLSSGSGEGVTAHSGCLVSGRQSSEWAASALGPGQGFDGHSTGVSSVLTVVTAL